MALRTHLGQKNPGRFAREVFVAAANALRLETLYDGSLSLRYLSTRIEVEGRARRLTDRVVTDPNRILLLMGGGKDSLYCYLLLKKAGYDVQCFYLTEASRTWQQLRRVYRFLDNQCEQHRAFLNANQRGKLETRYPWDYSSQFLIGQAIAMSLPYALASGSRYIALGLERSADESMLSYRGRPVNHQYQKSSNFVFLLNRYLHWKFNRSISVVSPVHGLYDMGIYARLLKVGRRLIGLQSSCGGANSYRQHCGRCEKCAFLAALLAGISGDRRLYRKLFPKDPLADAEACQPWLTPDDKRPLTCAGLKEEFHLALDLMRGRNWEPPCGGPPEPRRPLKDRTRQLQNVLSCHSNRLVPPEMAARLNPFLGYSSEGLQRILNLTV
jgi:7-cyano-7-deazaguanine synthase in queuosine biosynthesis